MRIYSRDARVLDGSRQLAEPSFRFPLRGILAPDGLVHVAPVKVHVELRAAWNKHLCQFAAVAPAHGIREGNDSVRRASEGDPSEYE